MKLIRNIIAHQWSVWIVPIIVIFLWQLLGQNGLISQNILPTPLEVVQAFIQLSEDGTLLDNVGISARRAFIGFVIGGSIGFAFGMINGLSRILEKLFDSSIQMIRTIPHLALIPLVILWFGIGESSKLFLVALGVSFPIYINTFHGIRSVDKGLIEMGKIYGLHSFHLFVTVILPGALPSILVGIRYALGIMWLSLIVAETISADSGIGYMAMNAREFMHMDIVVLSILLYALLGKLSDLVAKFFEKKWLQWHPNYNPSLNH
ncbi:binding-protein-dependent transporter inner membrane component [Bacillus methanolicus PB1]|uniref:Binding-protein-dependent transporter inner membrane component n=1 Tax=Bacillus methanolicus PB1 TaxID=997296 RepID=I3E6Y2_BACMT|nr:aliphatic sulfonate ABC transporter permease SsuC [Bacillus methanolicus]EIJ82253.1 binding-protein-dependent transporter inner membrane component [Bacillus methanolicus PB1]